jgi:hypothetical protein
MSVSPPQFHQDFICSPATEHLHRYAVVVRTVSHNHHLHRYAVLYLTTTILQLHFSCLRVRHLHFLSCGRPIGWNLEFQNLVAYLKSASTVPTGNPSRSGWAGICSLLYSNSPQSCSFFSFCPECSRASASRQNIINGDFVTFAGTKILSGLHLSSIHEPDLSTSKRPPSSPLLDQTPR